MVLVLHCYGLGAVALLVNYYLSFPATTLLIFRARRIPLVFTTAVVGRWVHGQGLPLLASATNTMQAVVVGQPQLLQNLSKCDGSGLHPDDVVLAPWSLRHV